MSRMVREVSLMEDEKQLKLPQYASVQRVYLLKDTFLIEVLIEVTVSSSLKPGVSEIDYGQVMFEVPNRLLKAFVELNSLQPSFRNALSARKLRSKQLSFCLDDHP